MSNDEFGIIIYKAFQKFLETHPRSNKKLMILHGALAQDLHERLGSGYDVKSLGYREGKEVTIEGRYIDKVVDISILNSGEPIAGIGVKFVMNNYSQNSNNYFENMLGETANLRCNQKPYFQILILPEVVPYYDKNGNISKWEKITEHNMSKYLILSEDNHEVYFHTPNKTLLYLIKFPECDRERIFTKEQYKASYLSEELDDFYKITSDTSFNFKPSVIYNDYEKFAEKVVHYIKSL